MIGEHFEPGIVIRTTFTSGATQDALVMRIDTGKAAYPFNDKTVLRTAYIGNDGEWKISWQWAEDADVHPCEDEQLIGRWMAFVLTHGRDPVSIDAEDAKAVLLGKARP
jgi:hypothetical protein